VGGGRRSTPGSADTCAEMIQVKIVTETGAEVEVGELSEEQRCDVVALCEYTLARCAEVDAEERAAAESRDAAECWGFDWGLDDVC
jgi:hypothetical protein